MINSEVQESEPKIITPEAEIQGQNPKALLQDSFDNLFGKRSAVAGGLLGRIAIKTHGLTDRPDDDPTLASNVFHPADGDKTDQELDRVLSRIYRNNRLVGEMDRYTEKHKLKDYDKLVMICPHVVMSDVLALGALSLTGKLGKDREASDNYFFLSRLIAYIDYKYPLLQEQKRNIFRDHALPLANAVQVVPETSSTQVLREDKESERLITTSNKKALLNMIRHKKDRETVRTGQEITFIAPTGSRLKTKRTSAGKVVQMEPISELTLELLYKSYKDGVPIVPAGLNFSSIMFFMPGPVKQNFKLYLDKPIIKDNSIDLTSPEHRQHFNDRIKSTILLCANAVSKRSVVPAPENT